MISLIRDTVPTPIFVFLFCLLCVVSHYENVGLPANERQHPTAPTPKHYCNQGLARDTLGKNVLFTHFSYDPLIASVSAVTSCPTNMRRMGVLHGGAKLHIVDKIRLLYVERAAFYRESMEISLRHCIEAVTTIDEACSAVGNKKASQ